MSIVLYYMYNVIIINFSNPRFFVPDQFELSRYYSIYLFLKKIESKQIIKQSEYNYLCMRKAFIIFNNKSVEYRVFLYWMRLNCTFVSRKRHPCGPAWLEEIDRKLRRLCTRMLVIIIDKYKNIYILYFYFLSKIS